MYIKLSATSANVFWSPLIFWVIAIPSIIQVRTAVESFQLLFFCTWSSLASDALLDFLSDPSAEQGPRGEEGRAIIIIWANSARSTLMITSLLVSARYLWISDFVFTWLQLPLHTVLDQRRERCSSTWAYYFVNLERLHHNLVNCSHVTSRCVNSRQNPMTFCETWTLLRTEILNSVQPLPFRFSFAWGRTRIQGKFFFSFYLSYYLDECSCTWTAAITSVLQRDNRDYWRINATFPCPSLFNSTGRKEVRTKMPGLDSNAMY